MSTRYYIEEGIEHAGNYNIIDRVTGKMVATSISGKDRAKEIADKRSACYDLVIDHLYDGSGEVLVTYKHNIKYVASDYLTDEMDTQYWITAHDGDMPAHHKQIFETIEELVSEMSDLEDWQVVEIEA